MSARSIHRAALGALTIAALTAGLLTPSGHVSAQADTRRDGPFEEPCAACPLDDAARDYIDSDLDGLLDLDEVIFGTNPNVPDSDGDGLGDGEEVVTFGTNPAKADTDEDGFWDGQEVNETWTNPKRADTDGDGRSDGQEYYDGTDPRVADEARVPPAGPVPPAEPAPDVRPDRDGDGLYDDDETIDGVNAEYGTDPDLFDTDGDGRGDGEEVYYGTDPNVYD
ncbi:MAG TPA: hypothetical protein VHH12_13330 [Mycobacterium sp.]|nr:hypothetical protein [Mycobacterium sp.]